MWKVSLFRKPPSHPLSWWRGDETYGVGWIPSKFQSFQKRLLHREQGVPLKGPFLGHFSQGILDEMNQKTHFSDFRIFCFFEAGFAWHFEPALLGDFDPATPGFEKPFKGFLKEAIQRLLQLRTGSFQTKQASNAKTLDGLECPEGYQATFYS